MIKSIRIDGFRHFKDLTINFNRPYTLLCGLNGTGKTALIEILSRLQLFIANKATVGMVYQWPDIPAWKCNTSDQCNSAVFFEMEMGDISYSYGLQIVTDLKTRQASIEKEFFLSNGQLVFENNNGRATLHSDDGHVHDYPTAPGLTGLTLAAQNSNKIRIFLQNINGSLFFLSINPYYKDYIAQRLQFEDSLPQGGESAPILDFDASNFAVWYNSLLKKEPSAIAEAFKEIVNFIPGFKQFVVKSDGAWQGVWADITTDSKYQLSFDSLSHGQKVLSILHLVVRVAPENSTIAIDELENFLSPTELQPLYNAFQDAYEDRNIQFILISHHPRTLRWYTDSAVVLSFAGNPPRLEATPFDEEDISLVDFLEESAIADEL